MCRKLFWINSLRSLKYLEGHWEDVTNTDFKDIGDIIRKNIKFEVSDHKGPMYPIFYTLGIPSLIWTCLKCRSQTSFS
jgi:hypothetical protein